MLLRRLFSTRARALPPTIKQLLTDSPVEHNNASVHGWIKSIRRQKKIAFAVVSDGSSSQDLQVVFTNVELARPLTNGTSVWLEGRLQKSLGAGQAYELHVRSVQTLGSCDPETYPIQKQALSAEYLRDNCHLRARTSSIAAMLRLRDRASRSIHDYFSEQGFCVTHTPILTSNDCEGAGEAFRIAPVPRASASSSDAPSSERAPPSPSPGPTPPPTAQAPGPNPAPPPRAEFFGHPAHLTVSAQLHLEALSTALGRVYTLSPCFRAERSQTARHLAEFWMLEAEWAFARDVGAVCDVVEEIVKAVGAECISEKKGTEWRGLWDANWGSGGRKVGVGAEARARALLESAMRPGRRWARMSYTAAISALQSADATFEFPVEWGTPLQSEHERYLADVHVGGPVFVTDYPAALKPFYMRLNDDGLGLDNDAQAHAASDRRTVACFDLLVPGLGELAGGSLREERLPHLLAALGHHGLDPTAYGWYVDLRRYGGAPHGGFGLGFERLIAWLSGADNVRECIAMPRWAGRMLL